MIFTGSVDRLNDAIWSTQYPTYTRNLRFSCDIHRSWINEGKVVDSININFTRYFTVDQHLVPRSVNSTEEWTIWYKINFLNFLACIKNILSTKSL